MKNALPWRGPPLVYGMPAHHISVLRDGMPLARALRDSGRPAGRSGKGRKSGVDAGPGVLVI